MANQLTATVLGEPESRQPRYPRRAKITEVPSGSTQTPIYGRANLKVYPINESQLSELGLMRGIAQGCLALSTGLFGFGINVFKDVELAGEIPADTVARWHTIQWGSITLSAVLFVIAVVFFIMGHSRLSKIKKATSFDV